MGMVGMNKKVGLVGIVVLAIILFTNIAYADKWINTDFSGGTYVNTDYNSSGFVQLSFSQTSGDYTSKVFDASSDASWNNISWSEVLPTASNSIIMNPTYAEDEYGGEITSYVNILDNTATWEKVEVQTWNETIPSGATINSVIGYCDVIWKDNGANIGFQVSRDNGTSWDSEICVQAAQESTTFECDLKTLSGVDTVGEVNNLRMRCTQPTNNKHYSTDWVHVTVNYTSSPTNLNLTARSCDDAACSGESWIDIIDTSPQELSLTNNQYFQYNFEFTTTESAYTPKLYNVTVDYTVLNLAPTVSIASPTATNYDYNIAIDLKYSATDSDGNLDSCWYNLNDSSNTTLTSCTNTTISPVIGSYIVNVFANDTNGEESSDNVVFNVVNSAPVLSLDSPTDAGSYNYNSIIDINFSVFDVNDNVDTCWYNLNNGTNTTLVGCQNSSVTPTIGSHVLHIYSKDTEGAEFSDSASFTVTNTPPSLSLTSPQATTYSYNESLALNYSVTDTDANLDSCWYNIDDGDNVTLINCDNSTFGTSEGDHTVYLFANDTVGLATQDSVSFTIFLGAPTINIIEPTGTKNTRTGIPLNYDVSDTNLDSCWYNVEWSTGGEVIANTTIADCGDITFDVAVDGNYILNLFANDTIGYSNSTNTSFSVDTSSPETPPSSGSHSGGGSSGSLVISNCTEKWSCSEWYNCVNGTQARTCVDINKCGTTTNKPEISRECRAAHCYDKIWNFDEESVDCGGQDCDPCDGEVEGLTGSLIQIKPEGNVNGSVPVIVAIVASMFIGLYLITKSDMFEFDAGPLKNLFAKIRGSRGEARAPTSIWNKRHKVPKTIRSSDLFGFRKD